MKHLISKHHYTTHKLLKQRIDGIIIERVTKNGSKYYYSVFYNDLWYIIDDFDEEYFSDNVNIYRYMGYGQINDKCREFITYFKI